MLHNNETTAHGDAGYRGVHKREEASKPYWHVAIQPGRRRQLDPKRRLARLLEQAEQLKAGSNLEEWPVTWARALDDGVITQTSTTTLFQRGKAYAAAGAVKITAERLLKLAQLDQNVPLSRLVTTPEELEHGHHGRPEPRYAEKLA